MNECTRKQQRREEREIEVEIGRELVGVFLDLRGIDRGHDREHARGILRPVRYMVLHEGKELLIERPLHAQRKSPTRNSEVFRQGQGRVVERTRLHEHCLAFVDLPVAAAEPDIELRVRRLSRNEEIAVFGSLHAAPELAQVGRELRFRALRDRVLVEKAEADTGDLQRHRDEHSPRNEKPKPERRRRHAAAPRMQ